MGYAIEAKEVILKAPRGGTSTETFVYEPSTIDEEAFGNIYVIGWLSNRKAQFEFLPNLIASVIRREFYKPGEGTPEERFEVALKKANAALEDIGKTNKNIGEDVHFGIVNIAQDKIRFCVLGDIVTLLWRNGTAADMSAGQNSANKKGLFSSIIAGDIYPSDNFIFSTGRVMDLFSESGVRKLFSLSLAEQAEIITKLYRKNSESGSLSSQAVVVLRVKNASAVSRWLPLQIKTKPASILPSEPTPAKKERFVRARNTFARTKNVLQRAASKRGLFIVAAGAVLAVTVFYATAVSLRIRTVKKLSAQLALLENKEGDAKELLKQLADIQGQALDAMSSWYVAASAYEVFSEADLQQAHLSGIHKEPLEAVAPIQARSLKFSPSFLLSDDAFIYVFGASPDSYLKIEKQSGAGSFTFLKLPDAFETERMVALNGDFYFINDTKKAAYVLFSEENELVKVVRTLNKALATRSQTGVRTVDGAAYTLEGSRIAKTTKDGKRELFLLNGTKDIADIDVSSDGKILLLTKESVLAFPHK